MSIKNVNAVVSTLHIDNEDNTDIEDNTDNEDNTEIEESTDKTDNKENKDNTDKNDIFMIMPMMKNMQYVFSKGGLQQTCLQKSIYQEVLC